MEKICEFCTALRPIVYCNADAAYHCLSCDAKVHSANSLSNRHLRTLLCDCCRDQPAYSHCLDHLMFMCRGCDQSLHDGSSQHQKRGVSSYLGCPSAKDFAELWGFKLDELDESTVKEDMLSAVSHGQPGSEAIGNSRLQSRGSLKISKVLRKSQDQQDNSFLLQQLLELKKLQLSVNISSIVKQDQEQTDKSSVFCTSENVNKSLDHSKDLGLNLQEADFRLQELKMNSLPLPFAQAEQLLSSSSSANHLMGESFWQCKSPIQNTQLWSQNMQDLGFCEDIVCRDDFMMPDVDLTFRNFEELFGGDQDPLKSKNEDKDSLCFFDESSMYLHECHMDTERGKNDVSIASSVCTSHSVTKIKDKGASDQHFSESLNFQMLRPSHLAMSFTISRLSAESSGNEYHDSGLSPGFMECEDSFRSPDLEGMHLETRGGAKMRQKEKKKSRAQEKQVQHAPRKPKRDMQRQVRGRLTKAGVSASNTVDTTTRSY